MNLPNKLTVLRVIMVPFFVFSVIRRNQPKAADDKLSRNNQNDNPRLQIP